jgi:hypothetical protein
MMENFLSIRSESASENPGKKLLIPLAIGQNEAEWMVRNELWVW